MEIQCICIICRFNYNTLVLCTYIYATGDFSSVYWYIKQEVICNLPCSCGVQRQKEYQLLVLV